MSMEAERLAREAEQRRSSLDSTLDALKDRFSPGQIVDEVTAYVRDGQGAEMVQTLNRQIRDNPLALGLIGAGAAWLLLGQGVRDNASGLRSRSWTGDDHGDRMPGRHDPSLLRREYDRGPARYADRHDEDRLQSSHRDGGLSVGATVSSATGAVSDTVSVSDTISEVAGTVSSAADAAVDGARRLGHEASDTVRRAGEAIHREVANVGDRVSDLQHRAKRTLLDTLQDEPLILGALAVAIGAAIGAALPSTRVEDEWLGDARDKVRDEVLDQGRDVLQKVEVVASEVFDAANAQAEDKGLIPKSDGNETMADKVSSVVRAATSEATDEAKNQGLV